jgi:hypothetical protein
MEAGRGGGVMDRHPAMLAMPVPTGRQVATHCPYCALQCGMTLRETVAGGSACPTADGPARIEVLARDFPTNQGGLCQKGWTAAELLDHPDRLTTPLLRDRKGRRLRPATWEEALAVVVGRIMKIQREYGRDAVAVFGGGGLTNEKERSGRARGGDGGGPAARRPRGARLRADRRQARLPPARRLILFAGSPRPSADTSGRSAAGSRDLDQVSRPGRSRRGRARRAASTSSARPR